MSSSGGIRRRPSARLFPRSHFAPSFSCSPHAAFLSNEQFLSVIKTSRRFSPPFLFEGLPHFLGFREHQSQIPSGGYHGACFSLVFLPIPKSLPSVKFESNFCAEIPDAGTLPRNGSSRNCCPSLLRIGFAESFFIPPPFSPTSQVTV